MTAPASGVELAQRRSTVCRVTYSSQRSDLVHPVTFVKNGKLRNALMLHSITSAPLGSSAARAIFEVERDCTHCHGGAKRARFGPRPYMRIQEEAPLPPSPLATFASDYEMAVVHLAWDLCRRADGKEDERTLLFAFVELLPTEIPPPNDDYHPKDPRFSERLGGQSNHRVYVRHAVVSAADGLAWYLGCRNGIAVLPVPEGGRFPEPEASNAKRLRLADLGEEPPWPTFLCAADSSDSIPFSPAWAACPRVHHLVSLADFNLDALWTKNEQERACAWLEDHLHFSLEEYPEYWGSVHLVAPNPVYREIHAGRQRRAKGESVLLRFEPRAGKSVEGLELIYRGANSSGTLYEHTTPVQSALIRMNFEHRADGFQTDLIDPTRGMLSNSNLLTGFLENIDLSIHLGGTRHVKGPTPESTYTAPQTGPLMLGRTMTTEMPKVASAELRLAEAGSRRHKRAAAERYDQRWFRGQQEEAQDILRGLLHSARREVLLVDPYFGHMELWVFTLAVGREDVPVRILTSDEKALKEKVDQNGQMIEQGDMVLAQAQRFRSQPHINPFEIKVMTGGRPAVHDRFLLVDDRIWLLGSSLSEFGSRGTMMVSLPDPDPIRDQLMRAWNDAVPLEAWVKRRRKERARNGGQAV